VASSPLLLIAARHASHYMVFSPPQLRTLYELPRTRGPLFCVSPFSRFLKAYFFPLSFPFVFTPLSTIRQVGCNGLIAFLPFLSLLGLKDPPFSVFQAAVKGTGSQRFKIFPCRLLSDHPPPQNVAPPFCSRPTIRNQPSFFLPCLAFLSFVSTEAGTGEIYEERGIIFLFFYLFFFSRSIQGRTSGCFRSAFL